jgi:hypothetical protein
MLTIRAAAYSESSRIGFVKRRFISRGVFVGAVAVDTSGSGKVVKFGT